MRTDGSNVVVSNSIPLTVETKNAIPACLRPGSGGLERTLHAIMRNTGGTWVGCSPAEDIRALAEAEKDWRDNHGYSIAAVPLNPKEKVNYEGFSRDTIWPLFHSLKSQCRLNPDYWSGYCRVNGRIAEAVRNVATEEDFIWVQDYQLMMVASLLRANGLRYRIGYSQQVPFPHPAILKALPWRIELLHALLQFDRIGFQTDDDRGNFLASLMAFLPFIHPIEVDGKTLVRVLDHDVSVGTYPAGIDFDGFSSEASNPNILRASKAIQEYVCGAPIVLAVDRLDSGSGIYERFRAFQRLLDLYPEMKGRVTLTQIVIPSDEEGSENGKIDSQIEFAVGQINRRFGSHDWTPIHYYSHRLTHAQLIAFYRAADVALITPLKGGMNLVPREFCACRNDERAVLLLSESSGAAEDLKLGALLVDPYNVDRVASVLHDALHMSESERQSRMAALRNHIRANDIFKWSHSFHAGIVPLHPTCSAS